MSSQPKLPTIAVIFMVSSLSRTHTFYRDVLRLELESREGYLLLTLAGESEILFFETNDPVTRGTSPQIVFGLNGDIDTVAEQLVEKGVQVLTPVSEAPGGWSFEFKDPDGHPLAYFQLASLPRRRTS
jgi:glyoxylase I family protein